MSANGGHIHYCENGVTRTADECRARGYCECRCGYVSPHPRITRPKDQEWIPRSQMTSIQIITSGPETPSTQPPEIVQ